MILVDIGNWLWGVCRQNDIGHSLRVIECEVTAFWLDQS